MAHVPSEGRGVLFREIKKKHPKAPDWKGQIMHNGEVIKISAWIKSSDHGEFYSLAVDKFQPAPKTNNFQSDYPRNGYPRDVTPDASDLPF